MTSTHVLTAADLAALATGLGGAPVVAELMASRLSRHLLLLKYVSEQWPGDRAVLDAAVATLAAVQQNRPEVFHRLFGDPLVGAWLAHTTRRLRRHPDEFPLADLHHVGALAASAAVQAGLEADLTGYSRGGRVTLPGLGEAVLPDGADCPVRIRVSGGRAVLGDAAVAVPSPSSHWLGLRQLTARDGGSSCIVTVEDGNPYRASYHVAPAGRLDTADVERWRQLFGQAWHLLNRYVPERAGEITVGLRTVVPLHDEDPGAARSGTARDSVGALGLTPPRSAEDFAITVVHEFQHSKLSAVLDLVDLYESQGPERHFAPWRVDPRPTAGLIQGIYAFLGMADTWNGFRADPGLRGIATDQFAMVREQVDAGLSALEGSAELTAEGRTFAEGMRRALDPLMRERLPAAAVKSAHTSLARTREEWRARNTERRPTA